MAAPDADERQDVALLPGGACPNRAGMQAEKCPRSSLPWTSARGARWGLLGGGLAVVLSACLLGALISQLVRASPRLRRPGAQEPFADKFVVEAKYPAQQQQAPPPPPFSLLSAGTFCDTHDYLWSGQEPRCRERCEASPGCEHFTTYADGWCQLVKAGGCTSQSVAAQSSAETFSKVAGGAEQSAGARTQLPSFSKHSTGLFCDPQGYLWNGHDPKCEARCGVFAGCEHFTTYSSGWCQLIKKGGCSSETKAEDRTAKTYSMDTGSEESFSWRSFGTFCDPQQYLWSGEDPECKERCRLSPECRYFTVYDSAWCQTVRAGGCGSEEPADDPSAVTYSKGTGPPRGPPAGAEAKAKARAAAKKPAAPAVPPAARPQAPPTCAGPGEDCRTSRCCRLQGMQCYQKNEGWAACQGACSTEGGWACKELGDRSPQLTAATWAGEDCGHTRLCANEGLQCFRKDVQGAYCSTAASPGWNGEVIGGGRSEYQVQPVPPGDAAPVASGSSLFCLMAKLPGSQEEQLVQKARELKASIFSDACKASAIYDTAPSSWASEGTWNSFMNTDAFVMVWHNIKVEGLYLQCDWTVKVDPDTVFMPYRLQGKLQDLRAPAEKPVYIKNCDVGFGFLGAIEIMNRAAVVSYLDNLEDCHRTMGGHSGEDGFLKGCLDAVGSGYMTDVSILRTPHDADCGDGSRVAFHPHKDAGDWAACYGVASR